MIRHWRTVLRKGLSVRSRKQVRHNRTALVQSLERRCLLTTVYYESFEGGLGSEWTIQEVDSEARVSIRNLVGEGVVANDAAQQFSQDGNSKSLAFDSTRVSGDSTKDLGIAILNIDLTGLTDAVMTFQHFEGGDLNDQLPDQHLTQTTGDGVAISKDGTDWFRLKDLSGADINRGGDGLWQLFEFDLGREIERINTSFAAGLAFNNDLQLKFSQWDYRSLPSHGWAIDELRIEDEAETFSLGRPRGVFHRFNLATENDHDYFFRAAVYGTPNENTPIFVEIHGSSGDTSMGRMRRLNRFVSNPSNGINSLIVVAPAFVEDVAPGRFSSPGRFNTLAWNTTNDAAADVALLNSVDAIAATGIGDADQLLLWGFSAGGQYVGRYPALALWLADTIDTPSEYTDRRWPPMPLPLRRRGHDVMSPTIQCCRRASSLPLLQPPFSLFSASDTKVIVLNTRTH
ncbi:MAG: hypothetical protein GY878_15870 [Fuerstiella sp.]|nr:hypothetical protein [Fuerstiella sp.]